MFVHGFLTNIVVAFTLYKIKSSSLDLLKMHKALMYSNILFPAFMCNTMSFLFVPYIMFPYPIFCTVGYTVGFGQISTLLYLVIYCWFILLSILSIAYSIIVNYLTVCHLWTLNTPMFKKLKLAAVIVPIVILTIASVVVPFTLLNEPTIPSLISMDPRTADFLRNFSALIVYVRGYVLKTCIDLFLLLYTAGSIACAVLVFRLAFWFSWVLLRGLWPFIANAL